MSVPPVKKCEYCPTTGYMSTFSDGETICGACLKRLPLEASHGRRRIVELERELAEQVRLGNQALLVVTARAEAAERRADARAREACTFEGRTGCSFRSSKVPEAQQTPHVYHPVCKVCGGTAAAHGISTL